MSSTEKVWQQTVILNEKNTLGYELVANSANGIIIIDDLGSIVLVNQSMNKIFGYQQNELLGAPLEKLIPERYRGQHVFYRNDYMKNPAPRAMGQGRDLSGQHKDGTEIPIEISLNAIKFKDKNYYCAVVSDISIRKYNENQLLCINESLEEFTYIASHDLCSPLRGIIDLIGWIKEDLGDSLPEAVKHNFDRVDVRTVKMEVLLDNLLKYARAGRVVNDVVEIDLLIFLPNIVEFLSLETSLKISYDFQISKITTAQTPLETILRNLITNAIKHHDKANGNVWITVKARAPNYVFEIKDDGPGIQENAFSRIFKLFQREKTGGKDCNGIGLALAKRSAEAHGGKITVNNNISEPGCTFTVYWPMHLRGGV